MHKNLMSIGVQWLFETCKDVFSVAVNLPSYPQVKRLQSLLLMPYFQTDETECHSPFEYLHLYEYHNFTIVCSKLLFGLIHIKSFDWAPFLSTAKSETMSYVRLENLKVESMFRAPCKCFILHLTLGGLIKYSWSEEFEKPKFIKIVHAIYMSPKIVETYSLLYCITILMAVRATASFRPVPFS
ncbi:hypothetical protein AMTRI_Chr01g128000 [Amborella trichopoda]